MTTPKGYVDPDYLRLAGAFLNHPKQQTYTRMEIETGQKVLDVGCGPGIDTLALAQLVGARGEVYGVDYDPAMVAEAEQRAEQAGLSARVRHKQADATALPFETGYFDACRSERLFQHLPDPAKALAEMARVTRGNGRVVVLDTDWGSGGIDTTAIDIERRLTRFNVDHMFNNGYAGRQLYRLFKRQGLVNVSFEVFPVVVTNYAFGRQLWSFDRLEREALARKILTEAELNQFHQELEQADAEGAFFGYGNMTLVAGQKAD